MGLVISLNASRSEWKRKGDILLIASDAVIDKNKALAKMLNEMACEIYNFSGTRLEEVIMAGEDNEDI